MRRRGALITAPEVADSQVRGGILDAIHDVVGLVELLLAQPPAPALGLGAPCLRAVPLARRAGSGLPLHCSGMVLSTNTCRRVALKPGTLAAPGSERARAHFTTPCESGPKRVAGLPGSGAVLITVHQYMTVNASAALQLVLW